MGRFQEGPNGVGLSPHIQHLRPHHRSMARAVALGNREPKQLGTIYSLTSGQVSRIMGSPAFQAEVSRIEREVEVVLFDKAKDLQMMGEKAIENLDDDLHIEPATLDHRKLRNNASVTVLGMLGIRPSGGDPSSITNILNVTQNNYDREVEDLSPRELRDGVMELLEVGKGAE